MPSPSPSRVREGLGEGMLATLITPAETAHCA